MRQTSGCSALEDLAAFAEGRLRGAEREQVITHLAGCADCREVLAESMETADQLAAEDGEAPILDFRPAAGGARSSRFAWPARAAALAAAAVVAVGAAVIWQAQARRSPPDRGEWLAAMSPAELAPHVWGGVVLRGGEGEPAEQARSSTEIGALLVDVDVALAAGDGERASDFLRRVATLCEDAGWMEECVTELRAIAESADAATMKAELAAFVPQLERDLRERFDGFFLDLGTFLDEAQLAARSGRADFLDTPRARRYLDWVLSQDRPALADTFLDRLQAGSADAFRVDREVRQAMLLPVRDELVVLGDSQRDPATRADAAQQALDALTR